MNPINNKPATKPTEVKTGKVRLSYCYLHQPDKRKRDNADEYRTTLLIPKSDTATVNALKAATAAAKAAKWGTQVPTGLKPAVHDGDEIDVETGRFKQESAEYRDHFYLTARSTRPVKLITGDRSPITDPRDLVSGDYAVVYLAAAGYDVDGSRGVKWYLNLVQRAGRGKPLGGAGMIDVSQLDEIDEGMADEATF